MLNADVLASAMGSPTANAMPAGIPWSVQVARRSIEHAMAPLVEIVVPARLGARFRWLLASSWVTNLGDGVALAAGPLLVASLTATRSWSRWRRCCGGLPPLVFGLYAGVLSDRLDRRRIVHGRRTWRGPWCWRVLVARDRHRHGVRRRRC